MVDIPDERLDRLFGMFKPKKDHPVYAKVAFLDTPGLLTDERKDNPRRLAILREAAGLVVVLDDFTGSSPLAATLARFREELLFADLEIVTNRIGRLEAQLKKPRPAKERELEEAELALLKRLAEAFETGLTAAALGLTEDEEKLVRSFQLLTLKPELVLVNRGDSGGNIPLPEDLLALAPTALAAQPKLELELQELSDGDRAAFMADLGMTGSQRADVLKTIFSVMGRIVFFTVGDDECRAWPLMKGADAVEGASQIHTDLAKRFVRAEVVSYNDFLKVGSMKEAKAHGVYRLEGKTYIVQDGDIMHILASS